MSRVVIVTGAAAGIGRSAAEVIVERWADTVVGLIDDDADTLVATGRDLGPSSSVHPCDVSDHAAVNAAVAEIAQRGIVVGLVNAAGNHHSGPSIDMTPEQWHAVLDVHLDGSFYTAQATARHMAATGGGAIVNFSSVAMDFGWPGRLPYAVAKSAIGGLTRTLAVEWADLGIRVNAVAPGYVNTALMRQAIEKGAFDAEARRLGHAMRRFADPIEIAEVVEFLLSDRASFMTGEVVRVDGGFTVTK